MLFTSKHKLTKDACAEISSNET